MRIGALVAAWTAAAWLVASGSGCVTVASYRAFTDVPDAKHDVPIGIERIGRVDIRRDRETVDVAFEAQVRGGPQRFFLGEIALPAERQGLARPVADLRVLALEEIPGRLHASRLDRSATSSAYLSGDRVHFAVDRTWMSVRPAALVREERTGRKVAGWTAFVVLLPVTVAIDCVILPVYAFGKLFNADWVKILR